MKLGDGLFLNTFRRIAEEYKSTGIQYNDMIVDNTWALSFRMSLHSNAQLEFIIDQCNSLRSQASLT